MAVGAHPSYLVPLPKTPMRCVPPQTAVSEHDEKSCIAVLQVLDYSEQMAGVSDDDVKILMMRGRSLRFPRMNYEYH